MNEEERKKTGVVGGKARVRDYNQTYHRNRSCKLTNSSLLLHSFLYLEYDFN